MCLRKKTTSILIEIKSVAPMFLIKRFNTFFRTCVRKWTGIRAKICLSKRGEDKWQPKGLTYIVYIQMLLWLTSWISGVTIAVIATIRP